MKCATCDLQYCTIFSSATPPSSTSTPPPPCITFSVFLLCQINVFMPFTSHNSISLKAIHNRHQNHRSYHIPTAVFYPNLIIYLFHLFFSSKNCFKNTFLSRFFSWIFVSKLPRNATSICSSGSSYFRPMSSGECESRTTLDQNVYIRLWATGNTTAERIYTFAVRYELMYLHLETKKLNF